MFGRRKPAAQPESTWDLLRAAAVDAPYPVEFLPAPPDGAAVLERLGVTERSGLGALALHSGGVRVDDGWLWLLGGGAGALPDLASANPDPRAMMLVGWDVLGGRYAIDGGGFGVAPGQVCYFAPDSLAWEGLDLGHTDFVVAMCSGALDDFAANMRWPGWRDEVAPLAADQAIATYPPLFSAEGQDVAAASRTVVPRVEVEAFLADAAAQLAGA